MLLNFHIWETKRQLTKNFTTTLMPTNQKMAEKTYGTSIQWSTMQLWIEMRNLCIYYSAGSPWSKQGREMCVQYVTIYLRKGRLQIYIPTYFFKKKEILHGLFFKRLPNREGREKSGGDRDRSYTSLDISHL